MDRSSLSTVQGARLTPNTNNQTPEVTMNSSSTRTQNRLDGRGKRPRPSSGRRQGTRAAIVAAAIREG